jgi:phosphoglycolate phosphatase
MKTRSATDYAALDGATIAFDLDGTLVESAPDVIGAINAVLVAQGLKPLSYADARPLISRGARWLLQWGLTEAGVQDPLARSGDLFICFITHYSAHLADESHVFPGVIEAVKALRAAGAKLVVCTNKPTGLARRLLAELEIAHYFDDVVGLDVVSAAKPNAAHLVEAVAAVAGDLQRTVMVGDSDIDAGAARAAGTPLVLVDFGYTEIPVSQLVPDALLRHFDDLVDVCVSLLNETPPSPRADSH